VAGRLTRLEEAINASLPAVEAKPEDENDRKEQRALAMEHARAALEGTREDNRNKKANRRLRWRYAKWVFRYLVWYSVFAGAVIVAHGFKLWGFQLPEIALGALVGSTAVSAIGLVASVVTGLFKSQ
jgi:hypothetical protein